MDSSNCRAMYHHRSPICADVASINEQQNTRPLHQTVIPGDDASKHPAISIVLPVYNVARYISECLDSLQAQTMTDFEMIFVDDESSDASVDIINRYAKTDPRICLLRQKHQSAGAARNLGMSRARGKYLLFIDPDDFCEPRMLEAIYGRVEAVQAEVCVFSYNNFNTLDKTKDKSTCSPLFECCPTTDVFSAADLGENIFTFCLSAPWNKLFLRSFLQENGLEFQNIRNSNDLYFTRMACACAKRITLLDGPFYNYRMGVPGSLQDMQAQAPLCFYDALLKLHDGLVERGLFSQYHTSFEQMTFGNVHYVFARNARNYDAFKVIFDTLMDGGLDSLDIPKNLPEESLPWALRPLYACYCGQGTLSSADFFQRFSEFSRPAPQPLAENLKQQIALAKQPPLTQSDIDAARSEGAREAEARLAQCMAELEKAREAEAKLVQCTAALDSARHEIQSLKTSRSFRIGRAATAPPPRRCAR